MQRLFKTVLFREVPVNEDLGSYFNFTSFVSPTEEYLAFAIRNNFFETSSRGKWSCSRFKQMLESCKTIAQMSTYINELLIR